MTYQLAQELWAMWMSFRQYYFARLVLRLYTKWEFLQDWHFMSSLPALSAYQLLKCLHPVTFSGIGIGLLWGVSMPLMNTLPQVAPKEEMSALHHINSWSYSMCSSTGLATCMKEAVSAVGAESAAVAPYPSLGLSPGPAPLLVSSVGLVDKHLTFLTAKIS